MRKLDKNLVEFSFRPNTLAEFGGKARRSSGLPASHALVIKLVVLWQLLYIMINWNNAAFEHFGYHYQEIFICQVLVKQ